MLLRLTDDLGRHYLGDALGIGRQGHVPVAKGDAKLPGDRVRLGLFLAGAVALVVLLGTVALVVVDGPGEGSNGHDQPGKRNRVQVTRSNRNRFHRTVADVINRQSTGSNAQLATIEAAECANEPGG